MTVLHSSQLLSCRWSQDLGWALHSGDGASDQEAALGLLWSIARRFLRTASAYPCHSLPASSHPHIIYLPYLHLSHPLHRCIPTFLHSPHSSIVCIPASPDLSDSRVSASLCLRIPSALLTELDLGVQKKRRRTPDLFCLLLEAASANEGTWI